MLCEGSIINWQIPWNHNLKLISTLIVFVSTFEVIMPWSYHTITKYLLFRDQLFSWQFNNLTVQQETGDFKTIQCSTRGGNLAIISSMSVTSLSRVLVLLQWLDITFSLSSSVAAASVESLSISQMNVQMSFPAPTVRKVINGGKWLNVTVTTTENNSDNDDTVITHSSDVSDDTIDNNIDTQDHWLLCGTGGKPWI